MEPDIPPPNNTWRRVVWATVAGLAVLRSHYGRRLSGGAIGLMLDVLSEGATQAFYARLPGHPQQAQDSLGQVGADSDLIRFRGETDANYAARVKARWDDYEQGGTDIQMLRVIDQWGSAGWPATWVNNTVTLVETSGVGVFRFQVTIPFGMIDPPWLPVTYGSGHVYGESGFFYGVGVNTDLPMLLYLVRKWKPSRSRGLVTVYWGPSNAVTFTV